MKCSYVPSKFVLYWCIHRETEKGVRGLEKERSKNVTTYSCYALDLGSYCNVGSWFGLDQGLHSQLVGFMLLKCVCVML